MCIHVSGKRTYNEKKWLESKDHFEDSLDNFKAALSDCYLMCEDVISVNLTQPDMNEIKKNLMEDYNFKTDTMEYYELIKAAIKQVHHVCACVHMCLCAYVPVCIIMCLCAYVPVCICACVHMCLCAYVPVCICACVHVHVCICACVHMCLCAYVPVCICACVHMCLCAYVPVCICACVHMAWTL